MLSHSTKNSFTGDIDNIDLLHGIMKYMPYNRRTLTAMRCVSKPFRSAVQSSHSPWFGHNEVMLSRYGQCVLFNAHEDEEGNSCFKLLSISPIGRKFRNLTAKMLIRNHNVVASGLTSLTLHHSHIDNLFFEPLGALENLRELELVSCRSLTAIGGATFVKTLERLEVIFCPLECNGVRGLDLPLLKKLTLRSCHRVSNLNDISSRTAASLEELAVENCDVYDNSADRFFLHLGPQLQVLSLCNTHIDRALTLISLDVQTCQLHTLHLAATPVHQDTLKRIAPFIKSSATFLNIESCMELESFEPVGTMFNLRFLDLSHAVISDGLDTIAMCHQLELLRIANSQIENISFLAMLRNFRVLDAPSSLLTDYSLTYLENSPELDTVVLTKCIYISDINVLQFCPKIRRIFCAQTSVTDSGIAQVWRCNHLEELDLKLTSVTDVNFLAACKSLKIINVWGTVNSADGIQALLDRKDLEVVCDSFDGDPYMDC